MRKTARKNEAVTQENLADDEPVAEDDMIAVGDTRDVPFADRGEQTLSEDSEGLQAPVRVSWKREADGEATVWIRYYEGDTRPYWAVECRLGPDHPRATFPYPPGGSEGTLELTFDDGEPELRGSLPLTSTNWFHGSIARWEPWPQEGASSAARRRPAEDAPPAEGTSAGEEDIAFAAVPAAAMKAHPSVTDPEKAAVQGSGTSLCSSAWQPGGTIIDNPLRPLEIFRCLWLRPAPIPPADPFGLGFVFLEEPESLPFYNELAALQVESDGRTKMMQAAAAFAETSGYVNRIAELGTPVTEYPLLEGMILEIEGVVPLAAVLEPVNSFLFAFGVGPLENYLEDTYLKEVERRVWQTLFAVALGVWDDQQLGDQLIGVLRIDNFLRQLLRELSAPQQPLTTPIGRQTALRTSVVLAEGAVPLAPGCTCDPPPSGEGWINALGIGCLKRVFQCLEGYEPGEVATVVNVMARERLELSARELHQHHEVNASGKAHSAEEDTDREQASRSDLRHEIGDLIAAEALCSHYNNLSQVYDPPTITLNGTWLGNDCLKERADREAHSYAQSLTRRAASRIVDAVAETRVHQRLHEQEKLSARDIDNRQGTQRLVGIYRWLKKRYRLTLEDAGKRLVVELEIAHPARDYLHRIRHEHGIRLEPPVPLAREGVVRPDDITRENYLFLASLYDIEAPEPPPPEKLTRVESLQAEPPLRETELTVPAGYEVTNAKVTYLLGSASDSLVGYVGGAPFGYPSTVSLVPTAPALGPVVEADEASCPECEDPFSHVRAAGLPAQGLIPLSGLAGQTDTVLPVTVLSTASSFFASVTLTCELLLASGLFEAWQVRIYDALVAGFNRCRARFLERLRARIEASSAGRERQIERRQIERAAIVILEALRAQEGEASPPCPPPPSRSQAHDAAFFENAFDWAEITYAFHPSLPHEAPCGRDPHWRGEAVIDLEADELFKSFLHARSARVLVPVHPGAELKVLFYLLFGLLWPGTADNVPVAATDVALVAALKALPEVEVASTWCLEIPTSLRILQASDQLPEFACPLASEPAVARGEREAPESGGKANDEATETVAEERS